MTFSVRGRTVKEVRAWHLPCRQFRLGVGGRRLGAGIVGIEAIYIVYSVHFFGLLPPEAASVCSIRFAGGGLERWAFLPELKQFRNARMTYLTRIGSS